jgi:hypothetical protein
MGEAYTGVRGDPFSIYYNPAGLTVLGEREFLATYEAGLVDTSYTNLSYAQPLGKGGIGGGITIFNGGTIEINEADGSSEDKIAQQDYVISLGYARGFNQFSIGGALKYLSSKLVEEYTASAPCLDIGGLYTPREPISFGLSIQNIGGRLIYEEEGDPLPLTIRCGGGYTYAFNERNSLLSALDLVLPNDGDLKYHLGFEYGFRDTFFGRLGYKGGYDLAGLTLGAGLILEEFRLDFGYGFNKETDFTNTWQSSLGFRF